MACMKLSLLSGGSITQQGMTRSTVSRLKTVVVPVCTSCTRTWLSPAQVATMLSPAKQAKHGACAEAHGRNTQALLIKENKNVHCCTELEG